MSNRRKREAMRDFRPSDRRHMHTHKHTKTQVEKCSYSWA